MQKELAGEPAEKFLLVHAVLEGLAAVDEYDGDLVVVLAAEFGVGVHVNFVPGKSTTFLKLRQALFHDLAEMTSLA
jgi:hypothetical protein